MYTAVVSELLRLGGRGWLAPLLFFGGGEAMGTSNEKYHARLEAGLCPKCGGTPAPGRKMCTKCLEVATRSYRRHRERGLCTTCGAPVEIPGHCYCNACKAFRSFKRSGTEAERWERREAFYARKSIETQARVHERDWHGRLMKRGGNVQCE